MSEVATLGRFISHVCICVRGFFGLFLGCPVLLFSKPSSYLVRDFLVRDVHEHLWAGIDSLLIFGVGTRHNKFS